MIRAILCDDEPLALDRLKSLLAHFADVSVAGDARSGADALARIAETVPDVVFLDVEMPGLDGFDVIEELARSVSETQVVVPLFVFVTAFPQFAAHAFETGALDFLTKPVRLSRLELTLARVREALANRTARTRLDDLAGQIETLRRRHRDERTEDDFLWVKRRGETVRVDLQEIEAVEADGEYVRLHLAEASFLHRESLTGFAARLDPARYLRVHRSHVICRERVASIRKTRASGWRLVLDTGREIPVGRRYRAMANQLLQPGGHAPVHEDIE